MSTDIQGRRKIHWWGRKTLVPERTAYKLEGDTIDVFNSFSGVQDYRPEMIAASTGVQTWNSGEYGQFNAGPTLNGDLFSFGFPGDYNDYNGLN